MAENLQPTVEIEDTPQSSAPSGSPAGNAAGTAAQQQPPAMGCTGDCRRCNEYQRGFCASQIPYNIQQPLARIEQTVTALAQAVFTLTAKVESLQAQMDAQRHPKEQDLFTPEAPAKTGKKK